MKITNVVKTYLTQEQLDKVDDKVLEKYEVVELEKATKRGEICYVTVDFAESVEDAVTEVEESFDALSEEAKKEHGVKNYYIRFQDNQRNALRADLGRYKS